MRSPIGPVLILLGLATVVVLVLLVFQTAELRNDLGRARDEVDRVQAALAAQEAAVTRAELDRAVEDLQAWFREWQGTTGAGRSGGDVGTPAGGQEATYEDLVERLDEVLTRITALDRRVDDICDGVPVC